MFTVRIMVSRLFAGLILLAGVAILAVVATGGTDTESSLDTAQSVTANSAPAASAGSAEGAAGESVGEPGAAVAPATTEASIPEPDNYGPRLGLVELDGWLNTEAQSIDEFNGKVLVVEMWTFGCFNCQNRIPHTQELYAAHSRDDFEIIGVHAPEFDREREIPNIIEAVDRLEVTWPVALDTEKTNFRAWQEGGRRFWPRTYVVDQNGDVRYDHIGEGRYQELADTVAFLIDNPPS